MYVCIHVHSYVGVGVGVETRGEPTPGVVPVGVLRGSRTLERFFGPVRPIFSGAGAVCVCVCVK